MNSNSMNAKLLAWAWNMSDTHLMTTAEKFSVLLVKMKASDMTVVLVKSAQPDRITKKVTLIWKWGYLVAVFSVDTDFQLQSVSLYKTRANVNYDFACFRLRSSVSEVFLLKKQDRKHLRDETD